MIANPEAEAALLGAIMIEGELVDYVADRLRADDFSVQEHGLIFDAIVQQHAKGGHANPVTLRPYLDGLLDGLGGTAYLAQLTADGQGLFGVKELASQIAELARRRKMQVGLEQAAGACADMDRSLVEIVQYADAALQDEAADNANQLDAGDCLDEVLAAYENDDAGVLCGQIGCVDDLLGSLKPKQLCIVAARPGMGKTAFALSYAIGAARRGHGVLFISLEMASGELGQRMAADLCFDTQNPITYKAIRDGALSQDEKALIRRAGGYLKSLPFRVVDTGSLAVGRLQAIVRRNRRRMEAKGQKLELVVIDYLQLVSGNSRKQNIYETVSEVSRGMKAVAKDENVAIMALAQLSREVEKRPDKRPQLSDLRDSGQIEQDADKILFLVRDEYYLRQSEPDKASADRIEWQTALEECRGKIDFVLAKRRDGEAGIATGRFHGSYQAVRGAA